METDLEHADTYPMQKDMQDSGAAVEVSDGDGLHVEATTYNQQRFNSTSSIFITSTISKPDIDEIIFCVAVVIHDRIVQGEQTGYDVKSRFPFFSEDNNPLYADPGMSPATCRDQSTGADGSKKREVPSEETIYYTIRSVYDCARFPSECLIVSLVYMERLIAFSQVCFLRTLCH